jgi:putative acetyltransferase
MLSSNLVGERALPVVDLAPASGPGGLSTVRALFLEYAESLGVDLEYQGFAAEVANLPGPYAPPSGMLLLARREGSAVGCVALRRLEETVCEMKRLYVRPVARGAGIGALLVQAVIQGARDLGYREMWLDTLPTMVDAHRLYVRLGFREIPPYGPSFAPGSRFYGLRLMA